MLYRAEVLIVLGAVLLRSEGRSIGEAADDNQLNYQEYAGQQDYVEQQGQVDRQELLKVADIPRDAGTFANTVHCILKLPYIFTNAETALVCPLNQFATVFSRHLVDFRLDGPPSPGIAATLRNSFNTFSASRWTGHQTGFLAVRLDGQERYIQENGQESNQPPKGFVRDVRDNAEEEENANVDEAAYQPRVNGDDDDVEQQPLSNKEGVDRSAMNERDMKEEDSEVAEQRDESNLNIDQVGGGGEAANFRPLLDDEPIQDAQENARPEVDHGDAADVGFEGGVSEQAAGRPNIDAAYTGGEQEHNYNYFQEPEEAADDGVESPKKTNTD